MESATTAGHTGGHPHFDNEHTVATWLHDAGYQTAHVGTYLNLYGGDPADQPGWDSFDAITWGLYEPYDFTSTNNGDPVEHVGIHSNDYIAQETRRLIEDDSADDRPLHRLRRLRCSAQRVSGRTGELV